MVQSIRAASPHDAVEQTISRLAVDLRLGLKKPQKTTALDTLQQELQAALCQTHCSSSTSSMTTRQQPRSTTRRLMVAVVRDFARANINPGPSFWQALTTWLAPPAVALSTAELASLTLALATLDVPEGSEVLLDAVLTAVCTHKKTPPQHLSVADGNQLRKALILLQGPGGSFRAGPGPSMSWLLALLQAREMAATAAAAASSGAVNDGRAAVSRTTSSSSNSLVRRPAAVAAPPEASKRETALTLSTLHRRILDMLTFLGFACESEVKHAGLNLDLVLYPPSSDSTRLPLVIEIDGPQHFLQGDPSRPTGDTAARRRLICSQHDVWEGLVVITYADEQGQQQQGPAAAVMTPQARLLTLVENKVQEQAGMALAVYRIGAATTSQESWAVAKRLFLSSSPEALLEVVREQEASMDTTHWATAMARMSRFVQHHHHHRRHNNNNKKKTLSVTAGRERYMGPEGVLRDEAHAYALLRDASFPAAALILEALSDYYVDTNQDDNAARALAMAALAVANAHKEGKHQDITTSRSLVTFFRALSRLGYRSSDLPISATLLQTKVQQGHLEAPALASVLDSLATILLSSSSSSTPSFSMLGMKSLTTTTTTTSTLLSLLQDAKSKLHLLKPRDLVSFVRAFALFQQAGLVVPEEERLVTAIVAAAGKPHVCQSLSLPDLALLTYREPAADDGKGEGIINQRERRKAPQWPLVGEVRRRLRALTPTELAAFVQEGMSEEGRGGGNVRKFRPLPTRAFLVMVANEVYKQRAGFTARERTAVVTRLQSWGHIHDPGPRFWQRMN